MFTGLIEEVGKVKQKRETGESMELMISCHKVLEETRPGDSIAVNGVCLTVTKRAHDHFVADVMPETWQRTHLRQLQPSSPVNLERAITAGQRMGGHFVQGHIDGVGIITAKRSDGNAVLFHFQVAESLSRYMVAQGSIAVDGISLTIVAVDPSSFSVSIIPHTLATTHLQTAQPGDIVNIECDMIGKYIAKLVEKSPSCLTIEKMREAGFM
jgi:riboflavin synthase